MKKSEFEQNLKQTFCYTCLYDLKQCVAALLSQDTKAIAEIQAVKAKMDACVSDYLSRYDVAKTDEERIKIVGSVKATDYENFKES